MFGYSKDSKEGTHEQLTGFNENSTNKSIGIENLVTKSRINLYKASCSLVQLAVSFWTGFFSLHSKVRFFWNSRSSLRVWSAGFSFSAVFSTGLFY